MALLVLLAAPAGARVVAAHLLSGHRLLGASRIVAAELQRRQFLLLLALDIAREVLHGALGGLLLLLARAGGLPNRRGPLPPVMTDSSPVTTDLR